MTDTRTREADLLIVGERLHGEWLAIGASLPIGTPDWDVARPAMLRAVETLANLRPDELCDVGGWVLRRAKRPWYAPWRRHRLEYWQLVSAGELAGRRIP